jgi:penicillin G amidase
MHPSAIHRRTLRRFTPVVAALAGAVIIALVVIAIQMLRASLPRDNGVVRVAALGEEIVIELDAAHVPRISAGTFADALLGQGFVHAQQRYFQMDLARRAASGELAALVGQAALEHDLARRAFGLRERAVRLLARLPDHQRTWLEAYAHGVNAGLADLGARPPEYWLLNARPEPWSPADSLLVIYALYETLSTNHEFERPLAVMEATLPETLVAFLTPSASRFDTPVAPFADDAVFDYEPMPLPAPEVFDLRTGLTPPPQRRVVAPPVGGPAASNQWAVGPARSAQGRATLANDPHLGLQLPNVFFRSALRWAGRSAGGIGVPGIPGILIGASDTLAWGATAANADQSDWVIVERDPDDADRYLVPEGSEAFDIRVEQIEVRGAEPETAELRATRWGPVVDQDWLDRPLALRATWLDADGLNLQLLELAEADTVDEAIAVLERWAGPSLNWMLADSGGRIGWTLNGPVPMRRGFDGSAPRAWSSGEVGWDGTLAPPRLTGGEADVLLSANNRTLPLADAGRISRVWMPALRATRIAALLSDGATFTERDFLRMQLDTRAAGYDYVRELLLEAVPDDEHDPLLLRARALVIAWNGRADIDQAAFPILHRYYLALLERVLAPLLAAPAAADPQFRYRWPLADESLRRLLEERPPHLLDARFDDWQTFLRDVLVDALADATRAPDGHPIDTPWGDINRANVAHPLAAVPLLGRRLRLPADPLPGSMISLRVAAPSYGATARFVVAPGAAATAILQMPGGQSGHLLSSRLKDLHGDWVDGTPTPFLPGPPIASFVLRPAAVPAGPR